MSEEVNTTHPTPAPSPGRSKAIVAACVLLILGGSLSWNAWDVFGTQGFNPQEVKGLATSYEVECVDQGAERKMCKRHIGLRHRECLPSGVIREGDAPPRYDQDAYNTCMRAHRATDLAELAKKYTHSPQ